MTLCRTLAPKLVLGLLAFALLCGVSQRLHAQAATPQEVSAVDVATRWVYALKRADTRMLDNTSVYPFELRILNAPCHCSGGKARDSAQLSLLLRELMQSEDVKTLEVTSAGAKEVLKGSLPNWAKRWSKGLPKGARLVQLESSGGVVFTTTYVLVVTGNQVRAAWLNAVTDGDA